MPLTATVDVSAADREVLESWLRSSSISAGLARRARIVLLAADGVAVKDIVTLVGASKPTVIEWRKRYAAVGIAGLGDRPKPGRRAVIDEVAVVLATLEPPPERLGVTHWSSRLLGAELGISHVWIGKIWRRWGLQPWKAETFKFSTDPELEAKVRDVVGLYLDPPDKGRRSLCRREVAGPSSRPDRSDPADHARVPEKRTHDYVRNGTTTLFAALEVATGRVEQVCLPRHRHQEFLRFLKQVAKAYPRRKLHLVVDNYATHKHSAVKAWLARIPRGRPTHPTPMTAVPEGKARIASRMPIGPRAALVARARHRPATGSVGAEGSVFSSTRASASIPSFHRGSSSPATMTMVAAGRISPNSCPCTVLTCSAAAASVRNMRVRTTAVRSVPASASAVSMISKHRRAWMAASSGQDPSGQTGPVPDTSTRGPARTARENPIVASNGDPDVMRWRCCTRAVLPAHPAQQGPGQGTRKVTNYPIAGTRVSVRKPIGYCDGGRTGRGSKVTRILVILPLAT